MRAITDLRAEAVPIGKLSKRSGVKIETIRYYERAKMLVPPPRRRLSARTDLLSKTVAPVYREHGGKIRVIQL